MAQPAQAPNPYLRTKILTATAEELRLLLYEGAIRFCRQARQAIAESRIEDSYNNLMRAQRIVLELSTSLNHQVDPKLCDKLNALYNYIYRRLVDANLNRDGSAVDECIKLLEYEQQTWKMLMDRLKSQPAADRLMTGAQQTAMASLSTHG